MIYSANKEPRNQNDRNSQSPQNRLLIREKEMMKALFKKKIQQKYSQYLSLFNNQNSVLVQLIDQFFEQEQITKETVKRLEDKIANMIDQGVQNTHTLKIPKRQRGISLQQQPASMRGLQLPSSGVKEQPNAVDSGRYSLSPRTLKLSQGIKDKTYVRRIKPKDELLRPSQQFPQVPVKQQQSVIKGKNILPIVVQDRNAMSQQEEVQQYQYIPDSKQKNQQNRSNLMHQSATVAVVDFISQQQQQQQKANGTVFHKNNAEMNFQLPKRSLSQNKEIANRKKSLSLLEHNELVDEYQKLRSLEQEQKLLNDRKQEEKQRRMQQIAKEEIQRLYDLKSQTEREEQEDLRRQREAINAHSEMFRQLEEKNKLQKQLIVAEHQREWQELTRLKQESQLREKIQLRLQEAKNQQELQDKISKDKEQKLQNQERKRIELQLELNRQIESKNRNPDQSNDKRFTLVQDLKEYQKYLQHQDAIDQRKKLENRLRRLRQNHRVKVDSDSYVALNRLANELDNEFNSDEERGGVA